LVNSNHAEKLHSLIGEKMRKFTSAAAAVILGAALLTSGNPASATVTTVAGEGSSFAGGILNACKVAFNTANASTNTQQVTINYSSTSSGAGRTSFASQTTYQFGATDVPYTTGAPASTVYVPLTAGPIAIVYTVPGLNSGLRLNAATVSKIFKGTITYWDDAAIEALNPTQVLPHRAINVYYRASDSGTSQNFVNWIKGNGVTGWTQSGTWATATGQTTPVGTASAGSSVLATNVETNNYSIGYVDLKDAVSHTLEYAAIKNGKGQYVLPTIANSGKFISRQSVASNGVVAFKYTTGAVSGEYNVAAVTYGLGSKTKAFYSSNAADALKTAKAVSDFFKYSIGTCGAAQAGALKYNVLTGSLKTKALAQAALIGKY
jgi:phosphate transport system substrate-binding protein